MSDRMPQFVRPSLRDVRLVGPLISLIPLRYRARGIAWIR